MSFSVLHNKHGYLQFSCIITGRADPGELMERDINRPPTAQ
jgi:hypothetical protein